MKITTHRARVTALIRYQPEKGRKRNIPTGPCLVERRGDQGIVIIWGDHGQHAVALPPAAVEAACREGALALLD